MKRLPVVFGSALGAGVAALIAPLARSLFHPPAVGVGFVTVAGYPKSYDYFVLGMLILGAIVGGALSRRDEFAPAAPRYEGRTWPLALLIFVLMLFLHDHPNLPIERLHDGEQLSPAFFLRSGERPYSEIFLLHGLASDGGLATLVLGEPPSPLRMRRAEDLLNAATLALLVPLAAEVCSTLFGVVFGVIASLSAVAAGQLPLFPWYRLAPIVIVALVFVRYVRLGRARNLFLAFAASTLALLWSVDVGTYCILGTGGAFAGIRLLKLEAQPLSWKRVLLFAAIAIPLPLVILAALGGSVRQFLYDTYYIIPMGIDATSALPAPSPRTVEGLRYFFAPVFYGFLLVMAWRSRKDRVRAASIIVLAMLALMLLRTASGRCSWAHTRFALPLLGISLVACIFEPLWRERRRVAAIAVLLGIVVLVDVGPNVVAGTKMLAGWKARRGHEGLVPFPFATGKGCYTYVQDRDELSLLQGFIEATGGRNATIFDFSGERALYYLLERKAPVRCVESNWLSVPPLFDEAMAQLKAHPPSCIIVHGPNHLDEIDGVSLRRRVPKLAEWIDANYPRRVEIGRYVVAAR